MSFMTSPKVMDPLGLFKNTIQAYAKPTAEQAAAEAISKRHGYTPSANPEEQARAARRRSLVTASRRRGRSSTTAMNYGLG